MPAKIELTEEQLKEMVRLRTKERMNYSQIARIMGVSQQTVKRRLTDKLGVDDVPLKYQYDRYFFHNIDTKEKAYWLGFITADGYVNEDRNLLQIHLQWPDREHLEKFKRALQAESRIQVKQEIHSITGNPIATLVLNGKEVVEGLVKQGVRQVKSGIELPPENIPEEFIPDYIRGLWDGNGHIDYKKIDLRSSYKMCSWVQDILVQKCGVSKTVIGFDSNIYRLFCCKNRINVLKYLYYPCVNKNICLNRKYKQAKVLMLRDLKESFTAVQSQRLYEDSGLRGRN